MLPAAALRPAKKRGSGGTTGRRPRKRARDGSGDGDRVSKLPDEILGTIISLLPTKDGARTQALARRWRPLWRSAPLNIDADTLNIDADNLSTADPRYPPHRRGPRPCVNSVISKILSDHPGAVRGISFMSRIRRGWYGNDAAQMESWLLSPSLDNLQEFHILFPFLIKANKSWNLYPLPSSVLRFATIVVATVGYCEFPNELAPSLNFPLLKHLTLCHVSISRDVLHGLPNSPEQWSIALRCCHMGEEELVIEDTPHLERLLCLDLRCDTIMINGAPKLEILGPLSPCNSNIQIGELVFQGLIPSSLNHSICTMKVLALQFKCT
ncbi:unnamed protein product [Alopecurus aequalis]